MKLPKRKETLKAYSSRTGIPLSIVKEYQDVRNAQRREARKLFGRLGLPVSYGSLMPDIREYTRGGDIDFFKSASLSGSSWLEGIEELYRRNAYGYLSNLYQLTQEYAPDPETFDIIGTVIASNDVGQMLRLVNTIGTDAITVIYVSNSDYSDPGESLDFGGLRRALHDWIGD